MEEVKLAKVANCKNHNKKRLLILEGDAVVICKKCKGVMRIKVKRFFE